MSISKLYFSEKLIEGYVKTPLTLKEQTLTKLAVQLCHNLKLKKYILCMSEPMYRYNKHCSCWNESFMNEWEELVDEQSTIVCKDLLLPSELETKLIGCIRRIALQMLSWSKQWQKILKVPRDFIDNMLMPSDWTAEARLNEIRVAERLVRNERITVFNRYKVASLHCLEQYIFLLCQKIKLHPEIFLRENHRPCKHKLSRLERLWYLNLRVDVERMLKRRQFWDRVFYKAIEEGERTAVVYAWKKLSEYRKQRNAVKAVRFAVQECDPRKFVIQSRNGIFRPVFPVTHHADIVCFLLSEMNEEQRLAVFQNEFKYDGLILECFLEWPYQEFFIPIITKLWNILPEKIYANILLKLAEKYINKRENQEYNYGNLLLELLEQTPESYKRYLFSVQRLGSLGFAYSKGTELISILTDKQPLQQEGIHVLQSIFNEATSEEKQSIVDPKSGMQLCNFTILSGNVTLVNWILTQCLPEDMIVNFKKEFFLSEKGYDACFSLVKDGKLDQVNIFLEWGSMSMEEVSKFKSVLILKEPYQTLYGNLVWDFQVDPLDRILQWCLPSVEDQKAYKKNLFEKSRKKLCANFIQKGKWEKLKQFFIWCFSSEDVKLFKEEIFPVIAEDFHHYLMSSGQWQDAKLLFEWFQLSPEQIKQFKKDTLFLYARIPIDDLLRGDGRKRIGHILKCCCSDEEIALAFKAELQRMYQMTQINQNQQQMLKNLKFLVKEQVIDLANEMQEWEIEGNFPPRKRMQKKTNARKIT